MPFIEGIRRADRDNAIDVYIGDEYMDVLADGAWQKVFTEKPEVFTKEEKRAWLDQMQDVTLGSDAFFPFSDNIERAHKSGVKYIAEPGGSVWRWHLQESVCSITKIEKSLTKPKVRNKIADRAGYVQGKQVYFAYGHER